MAVYTKTKTYKTRAHMGMIDITEDFQAAVTRPAAKRASRPASSPLYDRRRRGLTTLEFEPGMVHHDLKAAMDVFSPYTDETGRVIHYHHHDTGTTTTARRTSRRRCCRPSSSSPLWTARSPSARGRT